MGWNTVASILQEVFVANSGSKNQMSKIVWELMYHIHHENAHYDFSDRLNKELKKVVGRTSIAWLDAAKGVRMFTPAFGLCTKFQMILTNEGIAPSDAKSLPTCLILNKKVFETRQAELKGK